MTPFEVPLAIGQSRRYDEAEAENLARRTGWLDDTGRFDSARGLVQEMATPWWPECRLITMQYPSWENVMGAWIHDVARDRLVRLDGTSPAIHGLNGRYGLTLTADLALPYLGFFCTFIHAQDGMFAVTGPDRVASLPSDWPREKFEMFLKPATLVSEDETGFHIEASIAHSNALFWAHFLVERGGMCRMIDDEPQATDLGTKIPLRLRFASDEVGK